MLAEVTLLDRIERLEDDVARIFASLSVVPSFKPISKLYVNLAEVEAGVRSEMKALEVRSRIFPRVVREPAVWGMLLAAYLYDYQRKRITVTMLLSYSYLAQSTALRQLGLAEKTGLLTSEDDPNDGRRRFVAITDHGRGLMVRYFTALHAP